MFRLELMKKVFITGTDTDVGKTIVSAGLCLSWPAHYWKPIQAGAEPCTDNEVMARFIPKERIFPSAYVLRKACSPNQAARAEGCRVQKQNLIYPTNRNCSHLVIEGAGGLLVPFNEHETMLDLIIHLGTAVIITARSGLGTLNHSFLTLQALRSKGVNILGIIMVGDFHADNKKDIESIGKTKVLLELPFLKTLNAESLKPHFEKVKPFLSAL